MQFNLRIFLVFLLVETSLQAQELSSIPESNAINLRRLNTNNGMSHNFVFAICQDLQGFIWLGTLNGLNKFDGQNFKTYYNISQPLFSAIILPDCNKL